MLRAHLLPGFQQSRQILAHRQNSDIQDIPRRQTQLGSRLGNDVARQRTKAGIHSLWNPRDLLGRYAAKLYQTLEREFRDRDDSPNAPSQLGYEPLIPGRKLP